MIANVTIYKYCKVEIGKNFIVDDIESYLNSLSHYDYSDVQYQKIQFSMQIKLNLGQYGLDMIPDTNYNYLAIYNYEDSSSYRTRPYYFFIKKKTWRAQNTMLLDLEMDVINTFKPVTDFDINKKTHISRIHRDRFSPLTNYEKGFTLEGTCVWNGSTYIYEKTVNIPNINILSAIATSTNPSNLTVLVSNIDSHNILIRCSYSYQIDFKITVNIRYQAYGTNIDIVSEGLSPILYKQSEELLRDKVDTGWNLMYRNADSDTEAIDCYLIPDEPQYVKANSSGFSILPQDLTVDKYISSAINNGEIYLDTQASTSKDSTYEIKQESREIANNFTSFVVTVYHYVKLSKVTISNVDYVKLEYWRRTERTNPSQVTDERIIDENICSQINIRTNLEKVNYGESAFNVIDGEFTNSHFISSYVKGIDSVDKTDSKIVKIIKLPYAPSTITMDSDGKIVTSPEWEYDTSTQYLKLVINQQFKENHLSNFEINPIEEAMDKWLTPSASDLRIEYLDPKLKHSDFYQNKFVYDSFNYIIQLEKVDNSKVNLLQPFSVDFKCTSTINSRFLFKYNYPVKLATEDYSNIMPVARNNEVSIFSNAYLNYLRNGYNYDVKNKERQEAMAIFSTALGTVGQIASVGLGFASNNPAVFVSSALSGATSTVNGLINLINMTAQNEANLSQKIAQAKAQATAVSGSDDLDLMEYYSGNRLKLINYRCSDKIYKLLDDLFYYSGYNTDELGIPNMNSRLWFNYVACDLNIDTHSYIPEEIVTALLQKYSEGVTVLHKVNNTWDFEQVKENWEVSIL